MTSTTAASAQQPFQYSTRTLMLVVAGACILLAPAYWFGGWYLFSIGLSSLLVLYCARKYRNSPGAHLWITLCGFLFGIYLGTVAFMIHAFLNMLMSVVLSALRVRPKTFAVSLVLLMIGVYAVALASGAVQLHRLAELRIKFPFRSLVQRLAFDKHKSSDSTPVTPVSLASEVAVQLNKQDEQSEFRYYGRSQQLRQLHEAAAAQFAVAAGFGPARMSYMSFPRVELEPRDELQLPLAVGIGSANDADSSANQLHRLAVISFIEPDRMGYIRSREEVAGFEPHAVADLSSQGAQTKAPENWQVVRLELVSLLRNAEPRVYVSATLPSMDKLAEFPNRALNEFETNALAQLVSETDVVVDRQPAQIQMLGALRAGAACLQCHEGERGKLLGAFSYELVPISGAEKLSATSADQTPGN
jgi:hypothetical protein